MPKKNDCWLHRGGEYDDLCLGCNPKKTRGGPRKNSGRPAKYGNLPVQRVVRMVPVGWVQELDDWLAERMKIDSMTIPEYVGWLEAQRMSGR